MAMLGGQIILHRVFTLCDKYVTSRRYSAARVGGRMSGLRLYEKRADSK
jgi:hypothetical protein